MAAVRHYADAREFARAATRFLARQEALNCLALRITAALAKQPGPPGPEVYLAVCRGAADPAAPIVGVALRTPPFNLVLSQPCSDAAIAAFAADGPAAGLPGVIGPAKVVAAFVARWAAVHPDGRPRVALDLGVHELRQVRDPGAAAGDLRSATEEDIPRLTAWEQAFHREALPEAPVPPGPFELDGFFVWETDGEVVSMLRARGGTPTGAVINAVYTPPERRGRGFATAAVAEASALMLRRGFQRCLLFTDLANPTSNSIYQRVGYERVGEFTQVYFSREA